MTIFITGAGGGIGRACVEAFVANDGSEPIIAWARHSSDIPGGPSVARFGGDLLSANAPGAWRASLPGGPIRAAILAHGVTGAASLPATSDDFARLVLGTNYLTVTRLYAVLRPALGLAPSAFIVIASQAGLVGEAHNVAYSASKFAALGWVRGTNAEGDDPVRVYGLCPGATDTAMLATASARFATAAKVPTRSYLATRARQIAVGRYGQPSEIAGAAVYLATRPPLRQPILPVTGGDVML